MHYIMAAYTRHGSLNNFRVTTRWSGHPVVNLARAAEDKVPPRRERSISTATFDSRAHPGRRR